MLNNPNTKDYSITEHRKYCACLNIGDIATTQNIVGWLRQDIHISLIRVYMVVVGVQITRWHRHPKWLVILKCIESLPIYGPLVLYRSWIVPLCLWSDNPATIMWMLIWCALCYVNASSRTLIQKCNHMTILFGFLYFHFVFTCFVVFFIFCWYDNFSVIYVLVLLD